MIWEGYRIVGVYKWSRLSIIEHVSRLPDAPWRNGGQCVWSVCVQVGGLGARGRRALRCKLVVVVLSWHRSTNKRRFMTFSQPTDAHASRRWSLLISAICTKAPFTLCVRVRIRADTRGTSVVIANSLEAMTRRSHYAWTRGSARSVNGS